MHSQGVKLSDYRLPPGRHGIPPAEVAANQRWRLIGGAVEVFAKRGRLGTTSTAVARRAGVSPATFYKYFENISECLLATYEMAVESLLEAIDAGCRERSLPRERRLQESVNCALRFLSAEPEIAAVLGTALPAAEPSIAVARLALVDRLATRLGEGGRRNPEGIVAFEGAETILVEAALTVICDLVAAGQAECLPSLGPELCQMLDETAIT